MDERLRDLERQAHTGDPDAQARLARARRRAGVPGEAATRLLAFVGAPDAPPLRTADLPAGWDVAPTWTGGTREVAAEVRRHHAEGARWEVEYACSNAPPGAARGLLALLDELGLPAEHPARFALVSRLVLGLQAFGLEAFARGVDAALRRACSAPSPGQQRAFDAVARWLDEPSEATAAVAAGAASELRPDFSPYFNFAPTGNTDALDEAVSRWEHEQPVDAGLGELTRTLRFDREHRDTARALSRLRHVDPRELERAVRDALWAWASSPDARL